MKSSLYAVTEEQGEEKETVSQWRGKKDEHFISRI